MNPAEARAFCERWLPLWSGNRPDELLTCYAGDAFYRDPAHPDGLRGHAQLREYFVRLLAANPGWEWHAEEVIPVEGGFVLRWRARIPTGGSMAEHTGLDLVLIEGGLIVRNEVFFDRSPRNGAPQALYEAVDEYIEGLYEADAAMITVQRAAEDAGLPAIAVSPALGRLLHVLAIAAGASSVLEIGSLAGYSTVWLARALPPGGRLVTIEVDPERAAITRRSLAAAGADVAGDVLEGRAADVLPTLAGGPAFDMIFIDADKESLPLYLDWAVRLGRPGTLIVADNVIRGGRVLREGDDPSTDGAREFNRLVARDPRLASAILQIVGAKEHDGIAVAVIRETDSAGAGGTPGAAGSLRSRSAAHRREPR